MTATLATYNADTGEWNELTKGTLAELRWALDQISPMPQRFKLSAPWGMVRCVTVPPVGQFERNLAHTVDEAFKEFERFRTAYQRFKSGQ